MAKWICKNRKTLFFFKKNKCKNIVESVIETVCKNNTIIGIVLLVRMGEDSDSAEPNP